MKTGDIIKSFDFHGRTDCYMIGEVVGVEDQLVEFKTIKRVVENRSADTGVGRICKAPMQGYSLFDDMYPDFVRISVVG